MPDTIKGQVDAITPEVFKASDQELFISIFNALHMSYIFDDKFSINYANYI